MFPGTAFFFRVQRQQAVGCRHDARRLGAIVRGGPEEGRPASMEYREHAAGRVRKGNGVMYRKRVSGGAAPPPGRSGPASKPAGPRAGSPGESPRLRRTAVPGPEGRLRAEQAGLGAERGVGAWGWFEQSGLNQYVVVHRRRFEAVTSAARLRSITVIIARNRVHSNAATAPPRSPAKQHRPPPPPSIKSTSHNFATVSQPRRAMPGGRRAQVIALDNCFAIPPPRGRESPIAPSNRPLDTGPAGMMP